MTKFGCRNLCLQDVTGGRTPCVACALSSSSNRHSFGHVTPPMHTTQLIGQKLGDVCMTMAIGKHFQLRLRAPGCWNWSAPPSKRGTTAVGRKRPTFNGSSGSSFFRAGGTRVNLRQRSHCIPEPSRRRRARSGIHAESGAGGAVVFIQSSA